jgi:hypothetical protein
MVLAALASFAILLVAWIVAPGETRRPDIHDEPAAQPLAVAAWPRG